MFAALKDLKPVDLKVYNELWFEYSKYKQ